MVEDDEPTGTDVKVEDTEEEVVRGSPEALLAAERDKHLRLAAEFDNYRKRMERDMTEFKRRAADGMLLSLLDVLDNLDRALETSDGCTVEDLQDGLTAIRGQMDGILTREGVERIEAEGMTFDPYEMEAVMRMPSDDVAEGGVVRVLQQGYRGRGYVLRPSKVVVSSGAPEPEVDKDRAGGNAGHFDDNKSRK